ncbi:putative RNA-directed DNA polymerase from mobile element jockey-like [Apostichopus japonicus]|uniref:Putative RNA-directed DNA polymerase from mobile element jockey-like n=1 Tax=Stichopus japonicus TaxID=307972 RepID=A0A2G8K0N5_STIJA|nr:putative RNA-directed DNA polymerase from mobile element jockey-like [Apostichopus japonicus]
MEHFQNNNILSANQHAFRKYHSCETQLVSVINEWASSLDQRKQVDVFILDFEKAFDTVPHELLKSKLYTMGVSHQVLCWVDAFLSDREQSVVVNGSRSNPSKVTSGVPQGSVLGPILFLAYINDIGNAVSSGVRLFADDCVCYRVIDDVSDGHQLQEDINILGQWAKDWGMSFQPVKCNIMTITRKRKPDAKLAAYKGLLLPVLEYASSVWDPHQAFLQHNLENIQRRAARFIASDYSREPGSVSSLLRDLNLVPLAERRRQSRIILFAKGIYGQAQIPIDCLRKPLRRSRNMHDMHFCQLYASTNCYKYSFFPNTIRDWNSLPSDLISSSSGSVNPVTYISTRVRSN